MQTPKNTFKTALKSGRTSYGFWMGLCSPVAAELCALCGYDWVLIDGEHAPNGIEGLYAQLVAVGNTKSHPVVRIVDGSPSVIKQVLDIGALTILVPMVESAQQARQIVAATRYPPAGIRGVGTALARAARWNMAAGYLRDVQQELCVLIQVESTAALADLDNITAVDGIDGIFIGPADLAASMGHLGNPSHPEVVAAIEQAIRRILAAGIAPGILVTNRELAIRYENCGAVFVALGVDTLALASAARGILEHHRGEFPNQNGPGNANGAY